MKLQTHNIISDYAENLKSGKLNLSDYINSACDYFEKTDAVLKSTIPEKDRRERLLNEAKELYAKYPIPESRPKLFGILVGIKDLFRVDGFETRCGSNLPPSLFEGEESAAVKLLKNAGALIFGKLVTTEFAFFEPGPTCNPANTEHTPGGSSSGSAAAVSAGIVPLALGTQTIGSVIRPASYCGTVGFKPSIGRIPLDGIIPFSPTVDHVGIFTQDILGAELTASILCENWKVNIKTSDNITIGIPDIIYLSQSASESLDIFTESLNILESAGITLKRLNCFDDIKNINRLHRKICAYDLAEVHKSWYKNYSELYRTHTINLIKEGQNISAQEIAEAKETMMKLRRNISRVMELESVDIWASPSSVFSAPKNLASTGSPIMNLPWTNAGLPVLSLPVYTTSEHMPLGLQLTGRFDEDEVLFYNAKKINSILKD